MKSSRVSAALILAATLGLLEPPRFALGLGTPLKTQKQLRQDAAVEESANAVREDREAKKCSKCGGFSVTVGGAAAADKCFETKTGEAGEVSGKKKKDVVVWDPDAPCEDGESWIHYAGGGDFAKMTAGGGPSKHTYHAAIVTSYDGSGSVGGCGPTPSGGSHEVTWEVANTKRGGSC